MAYKVEHSSENPLYFLTFTCFQWIPVFQLTGKYDAVYHWFEALNRKRINVVAYVIMPNHVHAILHLPDRSHSLNKVVANGKRFMAYELIEELNRIKRHDVLTTLANGVTEMERKKGQLHKVFEPSFEAKPIFSEKFLIQKLNYIHRNPVSKKWNLVADYALYPHSSARFYESNQPGLFPVKHFSDL